MNPFSAYDRRLRHNLSIWRLFSHDELRQMSVVMVSVSTIESHSDVHVKFTTRISKFTTRISKFTTRKFDLYRKKEISGVGWTETGMYPSRASKIQPPDPPKHTPKPHTLPQPLRAAHNDHNLAQLDAHLRRLHVYGSSRIARRAPRAPPNPAQAPPQLARVKANQLLSPCGQRPERRPHERFLLELAI